MRLGNRRVGPRGAAVAAACAALYAAGYVWHRPHARLYDLRMQTGEERAALPVYDPTVPWPHPQTTPRDEMAEFLLTRPQLNAGRLPPHLDWRRAPETDALAAQAQRAKEDEVVAQFVAGGYVRDREHFERILEGKERALKRYRVERPSSGV